MLRNYALWLIFKFFIRSEICDENLISLLKGRVKTILASDYAFIYFRVHSRRSLSYFIISSYVHYFAPNIFMIWIAWHFKYRFLIMLYLFLQLLFQLLRNFYLCLRIHWNAAFPRRFAVFSITWSGHGGAVISNYIFGVSNHRNFAKYFYAAFFVVAFFRFCFVSATFYKSVQLLLIQRQRVRKVFINWELEAVVEHSWQQGFEDIGVLIEARIRIAFNKPNSHVIVNHKIIT